MRLRRANAKLGGSDGEMHCADDDEGVFVFDAVYFFYSFLRVILLSLNAFLGYCAVVGVFRPHFEIMFVLSLGLTASYFLYVSQLPSFY